MIKLRAQTLAFGRQAIGRRASWLGGASFGNHVAGRVEFRDREYAASGGPAPLENKCQVPGSYLPTEAGGSVLIDAVEIDEPLVTKTSNWDEKTPATDQLHGLLHFTVVPPGGHDSRWGRS